MTNTIELNHPVLKHYLALLRDKATSSNEFRLLVKEVSRFLAYEATSDLKTKTISIETPICSTQAQVIDQAPVVVSIMRAGNGMLEGISAALPFSSVGHIGIYRDKFINNTVEYYFKVPQNCKGKTVLLVDPLLATGDTIIASVDRLKQYGVGEVRVVCLIASKVGLEKLHHFHPDVKVFCINIEEEVNEKGYLVPGIGDAGDRLYNTKDI